MGLDYNAALCFNYVGQPQYDSHQVHAMGERSRYNDSKPSYGRERHERTITVDTIKHFESDIITSLQPEDLCKFASLLVNNKFIPPDIKRNIDIMHKGIPHDTRFRYVMQQVYEYMSPLEFLNLLNVFPQCYALHAKVIAYHDQEREFQLSDAESNSIILSLNDFNFLYTFLHKYCYKWDEIARLLIGDCNTYQKILVDYRMKGSSACLHEVLNTWLSNTKAPKLSDLVSVISEVGLGKEAIELQEAVQKSRKSINEVSKGGIMNVPIGTLVLLCPVNEIEENDSEVAVLLEATVGNVRSGLFQWYKDERMLLGLSGSIVCIRVNNITAEGNYVCKYSDEKNGTQQLLSGASVSGPYHRRDLSSESISVQVKTDVDKYKTILTEKYGEEPEVKADTWPVVDQNTFINLAVLSSQDVNVACQFTRHSIRGDVDDIYLDKSSTNYRYSFYSIMEGDRILVEGRPGSGKTTLVHRISQDWARGNLEWRCVRLLFLVHLRGFRSNPSVTLKDIVSQHFSCNEDLDVVCKYAEKCKGLGYCFILDGLDEYQPSKKNVFIHNLIRKKTLPKAVVIVSSRPAAVAEYRNKANMRIEVIGFFKEQILEYIESYKFSSQCNSSSLISYLSEHPNVHHMCYLPIQSAMICFLYDEDQGLPNTETQIYMEFAKHVILRSLYRSEDKKSTYLQSIHSLSGPDRKVFLGICKLAFEKTISSLQILEQADVDKFCNYLKIGDALGLIVVDNKATKAGFQNIYTFCHLTFQEFLAACHIFYQTQKEQLKIVKSHASMDHMQVVFKFFCGLAKFRDDCSLFKALIDHSNFKPLFRVQCAFETQQSRVCDFMANSLLQFKEDNFMTSSDFTAIGYVIANATNNVVRDLSFHFLPTEDNIKAFVNSLKGNTNSIASLEFRCCMIGKLHEIGSLICVLPSLQVLSIADTEQHFENIEELGAILSHNELKVLKFCCEVGNDKHKPLNSNHLEELNKVFFSGCENFRNICFPATNRKYLYSIVKNTIPFFFFSILNEPQASYTNCDFSIAELLCLSLDLQLDSVCTKLSLINCNINNEKASFLARAFRTNNTLISLQLTANKIGDEGAIAIAECLHVCSIQSIDLSLNQISDKGASALLSKSIKRSITLSLFGNNISSVQIDDGNSVKVRSISGSLGDRGIVCVKSYFDKEMSLETLHLKSCKNNFKGLESIVSMMRKCTLLLSVTLSDCNVDDNGINLLASYLSNCNKLHTLDLSKNKIGSVGAQVLAKVLKSTDQLEKLDLNENTIDVAGSVCLSKSLCSCQNIKQFHLSFNGISDVGAKAVSEIIQGNPFLQSLNLCGNLITDVGACFLADGFKHCVNLVEINLSRNVIRKVGIVALTSSLQHCNALATLDIGHNDIRDGSIVLGQSLQSFVKLVNFDLSFNKISKSGGEAVAYSLRNCKSLQKLNLCGNKIGNAGIVSLGGTLSRCSNLSALDVSDNAITETGTLVFPYFMRYCNKLTDLNLSHNNIGFEGVSALADALEVCTSLCTLNLNYNPIGDDGLMTLQRALRKCDMLRCLGLHNCNITDFSPFYDSFKGCVHLNTLDLGDNALRRRQNFSFLENCINLSTLTLSNNGIPDARALASSLKRCRKLQVLNLNDNGIDGESLSALVDSFAACPDLHTLYLSCATINDSSVESMMFYFKTCNLHTLDISNILKTNSQPNWYFLKGCCSLRILYFSCNGINDAIAEYLADSLSSLHFLDLSHNELSDNGVKALVQSFKSKNLQHLKLSHNSIGNNGVYAIADFLVNCCGMQTLDLSYNEITSDGIIVLAKSLSHFTHLTFLGLSGSTMSVDDAEALANAFNTCVNLETLHLMDISVNNAGALTLAFSLKNLCKLRILSFSPTCFNDTIAMALAYALKNSCNLQKLNMSLMETTIESHKNYFHNPSISKYKNLSVEGIQALAASLQSCVNFKLLIWPDDPHIFKSYGIQLSSIDNLKVRA